ncbi:ribonuclease H-like domain-containing protein, partial [Tanacetum coccineum]
VAETCWIWNLLRELHTPSSSATIVYCDNLSVVYLSSNLVQHQRTKHIEIDIHFVWDLVATGQVRVLHVPSRFQYADIFTKGLPSALFDEFRDSLSVQGEADEQLRFCKSWLLDGCTRKRLKVVIFCTAKLHQSLDVCLEGLCESMLGPKVVNECLREHALVTSLVTGNVPVENACADNIKTLENGTMNHVIFDDILDKPLQLENRTEAQEELTGNTEAIKLIMADVSDIEKRGEGSSGTQEKDPEDKELGKETTKEEAPTIPTKRQSFPEMPE